MEQKKAKTTHIVMALGDNLLFTSVCTLFEPNFDHLRPTTGEDQGEAVILWQPNRHPES